MHCRCTQQYGTLIAKSSSIASRVPYLSSRTTHCRCTTNTARVQHPTVCKRSRARLSCARVPAGIRIILSFFECYWDLLRYFIMLRSRTLSPTQRARAPSRIARGGVRPSAPRRGAGPVRIYSFTSFHLLQVFDCFSCPYLFMVRPSAPRRGARRAQVRTPPRTKALSIPRRETAASDRSLPRRRVPLRASARAIPRKRAIDPAQRGHIPIFSRDLDIYLQTSISPRDAPRDAPCGFQELQL